MKILLVAKPWRGGLAGYVHRALDDLFPGEVEWWPTRPIQLTERVEFMRDRKAWYGRLRDRLAVVDADAILFINHLPIFDELPKSSRQVLWLTDGPSPRSGELAAYGRVFLSDSGYAGEVAAVVGNCFGGEVSFGFSPTVHVPLPRLSKQRDVCFIGNRDLKRDRYLSALLTGGIRPTVIGNYFLHHPLFWRYPCCFRPPVANERMGRIYSGHKISLNIHADVVRRGTNMRTFECAAYGIPQLIEYRPGLEAFFVSGDEIATFVEVEELRERLVRLLSDPVSASAMALRARRRVFQEHSYHHRCVALLEGVLPAKLLQGRLAALTRSGGVLEVPR